MAIIFLGLGSNIGNREQNIQNAIRELQSQEVQIVRMSSIIETEPVGGPPQEKYLNAVTEIQTDLKPEDLLRLVKAIEQKLGRVPAVRNGPRVIDIDILLYDQLKLNTPQLTIPHPRLLERNFVLNPLKEIAPRVFEKLKNENH